MSSRPPYAVHQVQEKDVTVDWFFGTGHHRLRQLVLVVIGWIFVILPVGITLSALVNRHDDRLARRIEVTEAWYASKYGPQELRQQQPTVRIEPHGDIETYELRGLFHKYEVD